VQNRQNHGWTCGLTWQRDTTVIPLNPPAFEFQADKPDQVYERHKLQGAAGGDCGESRAMPDPVPGLEMPDADAGQVQEPTWTSRPRKVGHVRCRPPWLPGDGRSNGHRLHQAAAPIRWSARCSTGGIRSSHRRGGRCCAGAVRTRWCLYVASCSRWLMRASWGGTCAGCLRFRVATVTILSPLVARV